MARVRLITSLAACSGIGPGDEVIVPLTRSSQPQTAVLMHHALPVFVDTDPETFQIDARKIEAANITETDGGLHHAGPPGADRRPTWTRSWPSPRNTSCRSSKTSPARPTLPSGGLRRSARSAISAASVFNRPRT